MEKEWMGLFRQLIGRECESGLDRQIYLESHNGELKPRLFRLGQKQIVVWNAIFKDFFCNRRRLFLIGGSTRRKLSSKDIISINDKIWKYQGKNDRLKVKMIRLTKKWRKRDRLKKRNNRTNPCWISVEILLANEIPFAKFQANF